MIGVPLVLTFAYDWGLNLKVKGIWQAFGIANLCLFVLYFWAILATNWNEQAKKIRNRVMSQSKVT